jgi:uncharacterized protein
MRCDDGCGACCGPVPVTQHEVDRIKRYVAKNNIVPVKRDGPFVCPFFDGNKCGIHVVRPFMCQAFGHTSEMKCARGYNVNIPDAVVRQAVRSRGRAVGLLHEQVTGQCIVGDR